jgi:CBS domain-containing protein
MRMRFRPSGVNMTVGLNRRARRTMETVQQMLDAKAGNGGPRGIISIAPDASVYEGLRLMAEKEVGSLLVMEGGRLAGIFSERDYARKVILKGKASRETQVREVMTAKVFYVRPDSSIGDCMAIMSERKIRHLPVMVNEKPVGVISILDVLKSMMAEQEFTIKQLESYITGG